MDFNAVIVNLGLLDGEFAAQCIANIKNSIHHTKMQIAEQLPTHTDIPLFGRTILEQQFMLLETLEQWEIILKDNYWRMANNLFLYYPMLLISAVLFIISERFLCFGDGILVWGLINFGDHFFYTIKDRKRSPGLFSGVFISNKFCIVSYWLNF